MEPPGPHVWPFFFQQPDLMAESQSYLQNCHWQPGESRTSAGRRLLKAKVSSFVPLALVFITFVLKYFFFFFENWVSYIPIWSQTLYVAEDQISQVWPPHQVYAVLETQPRASYILGKHSTDQVHPQSQINLTKIGFWFGDFVCLFVVMGVEPRASCMKGKYSTTELTPSPPWQFLRPFF